MKHNLLAAALVVGLALATVAGCGKKDDPITKAEKKDADKPGAIAIKDIAKEAYIYGFPMLMNYGVMHAYSSTEIPVSSRRPSIRSTTKRASSRPKTPQSSRPTATPRIPSSAWTCGRSPSCYAFPR